MSLSATREAKTDRPSCQRCHDRKARFQYRGAVKADRDHTLCFECYRSERERRRAHLLAEVPPAQPLPSTFPAAPRMTERNIAQRARIRRNLEAQRRAAL